jgi:ABC-type branched-subunit amino acid transport system substrate-binding protein
MLRRAFVLLIGTLGLAACGSSESGKPTEINQPPGPSTGSAPAANAIASGPVAILLPLSGRMADIGKPMLDAAQLALAVPGAPELMVKDTGGTPDGAAKAAQEAIQGGARMILGPVTSAETAQVAPIARQAGVPVLAFTNDHAQAQPGVWVLGITPGQQVRRLLGAVELAGKGQVAALLPDNDFGKAMADELTRVASITSQPPPFVRMIGTGKDDIISAVNELAGLAVPDQPPPYGAILMGSTGPDLTVFAKAFADAHIDRDKVQILGPALWGIPASNSAVLAGAWFAAPDPDSRRDLIRDYTDKYKIPPPPLADLASDAASIARVLTGAGRIPTAALTQPAGFAGVDGWLGLLSDGQVRRGLAVFRVDRGGHVTKISNAPAGPSSTGS